MRTAYDCPCPQKRRHIVAQQSSFALHVEYNQQEGVTNLSDAITRAMYQRVDGRSMGERCHTCGQGLVLSRFWKFFYLPEILPIAVQYQTTRQNSDGVVERLLDVSSVIEYHERIDLSNLCERPADQRDATYRLKAVVMWQGGQDIESTGRGRTNGHYYIYLRRETPGGEEYWQRLNEWGSPRSQIMRDGVVDARKDRNQPRLLFYEKEHIQPATHPEGAADASNTGDGGGSAGAPNDPPADATYEPHITTYHVQWKPSGNTSTEGDVSSTSRGCGCAGRRNNHGPTGDSPATEDHPDETRGTPTLELRGGDGSEAGDDDGGPYAGFEHWTQVAPFRNTFRTENLRALPANSPVDAWRDILREHLNPTQVRVDYTLYTLPGLRLMASNRDLIVGGTRRQPYELALEAYDDANAPSSGPASAAGTPSASGDDGGGSPPEGPIDSPAEEPRDYDLDAPDPALEARLRQLEDLITNLENTNRPCTCPLNGQVLEDQTRQGNNSNPAPRRNRGLHIRLAPAGGSQNVGPRDYWVPLEPQYDNQNLHLRASVQVSRRTDEGLYPVRFSFSGPQPAEGDRPVLPRDAPFRNTIRFMLPFYIYPQNLGYDMWQEDIPDAPLLDTRGTDVVLQPQPAGQDPAGSSQQGTSPGRPRPSIISRLGRRFQPSTPTTRGKGDTNTNIGEGSANSEPRSGRTRTAAEAGLDEDGGPSQRPRVDYYSPAG